MAEVILSGADRKQFDEFGYLTFDTDLPNAILEQAIKDFRPYWAGKITIGVNQADAGRVQDGWCVSDACLQIATWPAVLSVLRQLYGRKTKPFQTLNFPAGTEQSAHSDAIHFNSEPFGLMCGVWVALEDVGASQGPLIYYPGSHRLPETNFPDLGLAPDPASYPAYERCMQKLIWERQLKPAYGLIKKGQAFIWAANLLHGGSARQDKSSSRHSQVTHYYLDGAKPWRPMFSKTERVYFEPDWISPEAAQAARRRIAKERRELFIRRTKDAINRMLGRD
ncbi:MAG: phytanoyl-CoA dioxygenase family protein [Deltaproteobacteria bacterium]|nr:phytanoyl-CoA dioxygenase family protein [Deltaproteobacteria bacterium]